MPGCAWQCSRGVSDFRGFGAVENAVCAHRACWDGGPLGLGAGRRAHFDQTPTWQFKLRAL
eukprot:11443166-Alexandrium_andersonii.AAC.1